MIQANDIRRSFWNRQSNCDALYQLWLTGMSHGKIAETLGVTRDMVSGKLHSSGLFQADRMDAVIEWNRKTQAPRQPKAKVRQRFTNRDAERVLLPVLEHYNVTLEQLQARDNRKAVSEARNQAYAALRAAGASYTDTAFVMRRNHSGIVKTMQRMEAMRIAAE